MIITREKAEANKERIIEALMAEGRTRKEAEANETKRFQAALAYIFRKGTR